MSFSFFDGTAKQLLHKEGVCYGLKFCVLPKFTFEIQNPKDDWYLGGGVFGRCLGHEGRTP